MKVQQRNVKSIMTKSKLPASDYAVNPYLGCPHKCVYCYACFMKRFSGHSEPWGDFIDIKEFPPIKNPQKYAGQKIFIGSVTDSYNPYEEEYKKTRSILEQFVGVDVEITIATKSDLITRDIDLLKQLNVIAAFSINTVDEKFRSDMDNAKPIRKRIEAMRDLYESGIHTVTFISPIFPGITVVEDIVEATKDITNTYWLENLNLRGSYKQVILNYITNHYPEYISLYKEIYLGGDKTYWIELSRHLEDYAKRNKLNMVNYFYHELIRKQ